MSVVLQPAAARSAKHDAHSLQPSPAAQVGPTALEFAESGASPLLGEAGPSPEKFLLAEIDRLKLPDATREKLEKRLRRKLIYTLDQLHAMVKAE
ncbi:MAG TPA: hypothetical protein DIT55_01890, partial [Spirochaetaceae bacterium]|nr:hypothetical protein [Spirochaetaceae bacterium]